MKATTRSFQNFILLVSLFAASANLRAQVSAFSYQGQLQLDGGPANGLYDFMFRLLNDPTNGVAVPVIPINPAVSVSNGMFTTGMDFGAENLNGTNVWLEINVRSNNSGAFVALSPRQILTSAPYAVRAITAGNLAGTIPANQISGTILNDSLPSSPVFSGTITADGHTGDGSGLTNVNATTLDGLAPAGFWQLTGNNVAPGQFLGSTNDQPLELRTGGERALRLEPNTNGAPNVIGGAPVNFVDPGVVGATIAGGGAVTGSFFPGVGPNRVSAIFGTIGGGRMNTVGGDDGFIGGGVINTIQTFAQQATIGGGYQNSIQNASTYATIGGGVVNGIGSPFATISGGGINSIGTNSNSGTISGGYGHTIKDNSFDGTIGGGSYATIGTNSAYASIGGGRVNAIGDNAVSSTIGGGQDNSIQASAAYASIGGGYFNRIDVNSLESVIAGGGQNWIQPNAQRATICGGWQNVISNTAVYATIVGGSVHNNAADGAFVGGGFQHSVHKFAYNAFIGGGAFNTIQVNAVGATIGGGYQNTNGGQYATVAGGTANASTGQYATVAGGRGNTSTSQYATVAGGGFNVCSSLGATVSGGFNNFGIAAYATVGGGNFNSCNGQYATIPGGFNNLASGQYSLAAGRLALAQHDGAFVWAGGATNFYPSIVTNMFNVYAANGVGFDYAGQRPDGRGNRWFYVGPQNAGLTITVWNGASLTDGGIWSNASDQNRKTDFKQVDGRQILESLVELPVREWRYTNEAPGIKHFGPTAQDFRAAFGLGTDEKSIGTIDADGVALAAIQGLDQKVVSGMQKTETRMAKLEAENGELKRRLEKLERLLVGTK